ncbi:MAG TPA: anthranilate synthase component I family protein [Bacteroidia bacterium]|nr:anthranilate synthase component I family protein [Bacteroidia bacterium]HNT79380.1 anthranilate synthase component I family protein [Bacteroidia bacterium]
MSSEDFSLVPYPINELTRDEIIQFCSSYSVVCVLDSCTDAHKDQNPVKGKYDLLIGAGVAEQIPNDDITTVEQFIQKSLQEGKWVFGHFSYSIKDKIENLSSRFLDQSGFPEWYFFQPEIILAIKDSTLFIGCQSSKSSDEIYHDLVKTEKLPEQFISGFSLQPSIGEKEYMENASHLIENINYGNIYEVNYCMQFLSYGSDIAPLATYFEQRKKSPAPFSSYYKINQSHLLCSSPERFLCKRGNKVYSQPIKGTRKRVNEPKEDSELKLELQMDEKERSENVMIVDLVRNDLSKNALKGTVETEELFGVYSFQHVHQMISTVSAEVDHQCSSLKIILDAFPMGSMTGAPKYKAMQLIDQYENFNRGIYSGSVGYFDPNGDFDFNVVIRSLVYNHENKLISLMAGSALTSKCNPETEYQECLLKAKALMQNQTKGPIE